MPWNMFWTIVWQVVLFCAITAVPIALWLLLVVAAFQQSAPAKKVIYRG